MKGDDLFKPPWFEVGQISELDMSIISIFWGFSLCLAGFAGLKAWEQSRRSWKRQHKVTTYIIMIWTHLILNTVDGCVAWFYLFRKIKPGFWVFLWFCIVWAIQIQLVMQIIINRIALLMSDQRRAKQLKWSVFIIVTIIGLVVAIVWMPSALQITEQWTAVNFIWDRLKQCILTVIDIGLNCYFLYMVRKHLIANGLQKYTNLFRYNVAMVILVLLLDATLIGLMSLKIRYAYLQFQIIVYLTRLYIEMANADLIRKIISQGNFDNGNSSIIVPSGGHIDGQSHSSTDPSSTTADDPAMKHSHSASLSHATTHRASQASYYHQYQYRSSLNQESYLELGLAHVETNDSIFLTVPKTATAAQTRTGVSTKEDAITETVRQTPGPLDP